MLVALVTPWIMFFLWPVQIHGAISFSPPAPAVCCIGNSVGTCLLGLCLTACSAIMHLDLLMTHGNIDAVRAKPVRHSPGFSPRLRPDHQQLHHRHAPRHGLGRSRGRSGVSIFVAHALARAVNG